MATSESNEDGSESDGYWDEDSDTYWCKKFEEYAGKWSAGQRSVSPTTSHNELAMANSKEHNKNTGE